MIVLFASEKTDKPYDSKRENKRVKNYGQERENKPSGSKRGGK